MSSSKPSEDVIFPELEPGVINHEMIKKAYEEGGYKGEAGRLHKEEEVEYDKIHTLRLEFKNIIRIDHLWVLPNITKLSLNFNKIEKIENLDMLVNLKELDLSFNYIEKVENLESLTKLETLSLYNNLITDIENLDTLENLIILSLGNNKVETTKGVLNLQGNPITEKMEDFRTYIVTILPRVMYYEYSLVLPEEREKGREIFRRELREIEQNEEDELELRNKKRKELEDEVRLSSSFVELLNEHQLFDSLFVGDEDGEALRMIGEEAQELIKEFKLEFYAITQEIYKIGLARFDEREKEIEMFFKSIKYGQDKAQKNGQRVIENFMEYKLDTFKEVKEITKSINELLLSGKSEDSPSVVAQNEYLDQVVEKYNTKLEEIWQELMEEEMMMFETIEEAIGNFARNINEMINSFIEQVQTNFVILRDVASNFSDSMQEAASRYISFMLASGLTKEVPEELQECLEDRDAVANLVIGMRDFHMQKIDGREDKLVSRGRAWVNDLISKTRQDELERSRMKINEINYYVDQMREALEDYRNELFQSTGEDE